MDTALIKTLAEKFYDQVVDLRHYFHRNPEIAFDEIKSAAKIKETLIEMGLEVQSGVAGTGVVALIRGKYPGRTVLLRADMDALRIQEEADVEYRSEVDGMMHACAHDGHMANLLGVAMILNELKSEIRGNIKLIFQPAEEAEGGALPMIAEGVLKAPQVDAAFACHLWGSVPEGVIEVREGAFMAAPDFFTVKIIGRGGHGAMPQQTIDPIVLAAQVIDQTQTVISRKKDPLIPAVISFTKIHGGDSFNVIPNEVELAGTFRTFDEKTRRWIPEAMESILKSVTEASGASYSLDVMWRCPALINDEAMTTIVKESAEKILGRENVRRCAQPNMGGDDFAYIAEVVPSSYFFVGIAPSEEEHVVHHHPKFQWDDRNLLTAMEVLAQVAVDYLMQ